MSGSEKVDTCVFHKSCTDKMVPKIDHERDLSNIKVGHEEDMRKAAEATNEKLDKKASRGWVNKVAGGFCVVLISFVAWADGKETTIDERLDKVVTAVEKLVVLQEQDQKNFKAICDKEEADRKLIEDHIERDWEDHHRGKIGDTQ